MSQRTGYLFVDHRASPGIPEDIAIASGMDPNQVKGGKLFEADTLTCVHCKTAVLKNPDRIRARGSCIKCGGKYVCDGCAIAMKSPDYNHVPYDMRVDMTMEGKLGSLMELLNLPPTESL